MSENSLKYLSRLKRLIEPPHWINRAASTVKTTRDRQKYVSSLFVEKDNTDILTTTDYTDLTDYHIYIILFVSNA